LTNLERMTPREVQLRLDPVETVCKPPFGKPFGVKTQSDLVSNDEKPTEMFGSPSEARSVLDPCGSKKQQSVDTPLVLAVNNGH
jgi:hypothetical protein